MRWKIFRVVAVVLLVALPFGIRWLYLRMTALPAVVTIATGPVGGRYRELAQDLAEELQSRFDVNVELVPSSGSLENLQLLLEGRADFAMYQPQTLEFLNEFDPDASAETRAAYERHGAESVTFVANLYVQPAHIIVHSGEEVTELGRMAEKHVHLGFPASGDRAMAMLLLKHVGLSKEDVELVEFDSYDDVRSGFADATLDATIITVGVHAPIFRQLFADGHCEMLDVPYRDALTAQHVALVPYTIPAGLFRSDKRPGPARDIETVALKAQLLARRDANERLVEAVTRIVLGPEFARRNRLAELVTGDLDFARARPSFDLHPGSLDVYDPNLHPVLDSEFVEATEGMRSFLASIAIAGFFLFRWLHRRRVRKQEHKLDRYIKKLLEFELRQLDMDESAVDGRDIDVLQRLLDEITRLRQEALGEFTAHELNEDRAVDCFVEMCHALSDKLNAKLTRQRLAQATAQITAALEARTPESLLETEE